MVVHGVGKDTHSVGLLEQYVFLSRCDDQRVCHRTSAEAAGCRNGAGDDDDDDSNDDDACYVVDDGNEW